MILDNWISKKIHINSPLDRETLEKYQLEKLNDLIEYVKDNSKFYNRLYKDIEKINYLEEMDKIPIINKDDIINYGTKMICVTQSDISRIISLNTSGTMGKCKRIFFTEEDQKLTIDFFSHGLQYIVQRDDVMLIMMPCKRENSVGDLIKKALDIMGVKPITNGILTSFKETIDLMIKNKVNSIVGMPVEILALGRYIKINNLPIHIKSILLSADMVNNKMIERIKKLYNCKVYNHFGMTEAGLGVAVECDCHNGMHIRENDLLMEIVDPITKKKLNDGEDGEILITTLTRKAMPLIRYATGDVSNLKDEECKCKSILKRLDNIKLRIEDNVYLKDNLSVNVSMLDDILFDLENLINYKVIIKKDIDYYELKLQLVFFVNSNIDIISIEAVKSLLLKNHTIKQLYEDKLLIFNINYMYSKEYINLYEVKRKIILS